MKNLIGFIMAISIIMLASYLSNIGEITIGEQGTIVVLALILQSIIYLND